MVSLSFSVIYAFLVFNCHIKLSFIKIRCFIESNMIQRGSTIYKDCPPIRQTLILIKRVLLKITLREL